MNNLSPTTVASAGRVMAPFLGYVWPDNRKEIVENVNRYRNVLFNRYQHRKMFADVFHCFAPQTFPDTCEGRCCTYVGATLPPDMQGVVKAWQYGQPLRVRSRWREALTGIGGCGSALEIIVMPRKFPTERDIRMADYLTVFTDAACDSGKVMWVEARLKNGKNEKLKFTLSGDEWVQSPVMASEIHSVVLPALSGKVTLSTKAGYILSEYAPWEEVPNYTRVKIPQACPENILIQGTRQFVPVWFDADIVEVGDAVIMEWMAQYLRYNKSRDGNEQKVAERALAQAYDSLDGLMARDMAGAIQDNIRRGAKPTRALPGYGRSHRCL